MFGRDVIVYVRYDYPILHPHLAFIGQSGQRRLRIYRGKPW